MTKVVFRLKQYYNLYALYLWNLLTKEILNNSEEFFKDILCDNLKLRFKDENIPVLYNPSKKSELHFDIENIGYTEIYAYINDKPFDFTSISKKINSMMEGYNVSIVIQNNSICN